ncbi:MAG: hypothetical protein QG599_2782 [Pseudomonadota bacterium]|nr:hypothetical protein [Pseudomonadota bacterium]
MIRLRNLQRLMARYDSQVAFASALGQSPQYLNQILTGQRNIGEKTARKIEQALNLASGELDQDALASDRVASVPWLSEDHRQLLAEYAQLSPLHQTMVRETIQAYLKLEQSA